MASELWISKRAALWAILGYWIHHTHQKIISIIRDIVVIMKTTIAVSDDTKKLLKDLGRKGETYDEIILNLLRKDLDDRWNRILRDEEFISIDEL